MNNVRWVLRRGQPGCFDAIVKSADFQFGQGGSIRGPVVTEQDGPRFDVLLQGTFTASQNTNVGADAISTNLSLNIRVTPVDPFSVGEIVTAGVAAIAAVGDACAVNPVGCVIIAGAG